jgi:tetratricopeptide (TPR) repeat protein
MPDLLDEMQQAVSLYIRGRPEEAVEIGRRLLTRARGTPHAATLYRTMSEFLHAIGNYSDARELAREAGSLARAMRHPEEILASSLAILTCDLYEGDVTAVFKETSELQQLAPDQPMTRLLMAQVMLTVGDLSEALELLQDTYTLLDERAAEGHPELDLLRANLLTTEGKAHLLASDPAEAAAVLERSIAMEVPTLVPGTLARAMLGQALVQLGEEERGLELVEQATGLARKISRDVHGHTLTLAGLARLQLGDVGIANEQIRAAVALLTHPLERQESFFLLGEIALLLDEDGDAVQAFRRATEPTIDSLFGRKALRELRKLVGLRVV